MNFWFFVVAKLKVWKAQKQQLINFSALGNFLKLTKTVQNVTKFGTKFPENLFKMDQKSPNCNIGDQFQKISECRKIYKLLFLSFSDL